MSAYFLFVVQSEFCLYTALKLEKKINQKIKQICVPQKSHLRPLPAQKAPFSFSSHKAAHTCKLEEKVSLARIWLRQK